MGTTPPFPRLPRGRAGVAAGAGTIRDGDCFGPVVNLAARAVKHAAPSQVVAAREVADAVRGVLHVTPLPEVELAGFDGAVVAYDAAASSAVRFGRRRHGSVRRLQSTLPVFLI